MGAKITRIQERPIPPAFHVPRETFLAMDGKAG